MAAAAGASFSAAAATSSSTNIQVLLMPSGSFTKAKAGKPAPAARGSGGRHLDGSCCSAEVLRQLPAARSAWTTTRAGGASLGRGSGCRTAILQQQQLAGLWSLQVCSIAVVLSGERGRLGGCRAAEQLRLEPGQHFTDGDGGWWCGWSGGLSRRKSFAPAGGNGSRPASSASRA